MIVRCLITPVGVIALCAVWLTGCEQQSASDPTPAPTTDPVIAGESRHPANESEPAFVDATASLGLDHTYQNGLSESFHIAEPIGGGLAALDYDLDGDIDLYLLQGGDPHASPASSSGDRLYRNLLSETGSLHFRDETEAAGIRQLAFALGVTVGDVDGNGWPDLYVTNYGPNALLINNTDGTFTDSAQRMGVQVAEMSSGAALFDYDGDGDEDLFVANYVDGDQPPGACFSRNGRRDYCAPKAWQAVANRLFRNDGDRYADVTAQMGIQVEPGPSFQALPVDINHDGWIDLLVANDGAENRLWINQGGRVFTEQAALYGLAVNIGGLPEASMGVDLSDYNGDGQVDILMTHLRGESNTLYQRLATDSFLDRSSSTGMVSGDLPYTGWGLRWLDYNLDGWPDLFLVNGGESIGNQGSQLHGNAALAQPNAAYRNAGNGSFVSVNHAMPESWLAPSNSRGLVSADFDNDGRVDLAVVHPGKASQILINQTPQGPWAGVELRLPDGGWWRYGAVLTTSLPPGSVSTVNYPLGGFLSFSDPRLVIATEGDTAQWARIGWGQSEQLVCLRPGEYQHVVLGEAVAEVECQ